jgi:Nitroreductase family
MVSATDDPWAVSKIDIPSNASPADSLRWAVSYAILAPSGHNTQPWRFRIAGDRVEVYADRTRALAVVDPDDRELTIGCGAALLHLRLALEHLGVVPEVSILPDGEEADLLARVRLGPHFPAPPEEEALFAAIPLRRTNRQPFDDRPIPGRLLPALVAATAGEGVWLRAVEGETRHAVAELVEEGDRIQWTDKHFRRELAAWLHPSHRGDGMHAFYRHGLGPVVVRTLDLGKSMGHKDRELAEQAPLLVVLGTDGDTPSDWLAVGQALARVLLRARVDGIDASYLHQPIQVAELRPRLAAAIGATGHPQLMLRLGYGPEVEPSPRRPLETVLID